ncbi:hypothetical protein K431DRAFT_332594 [Polychaeton citri CBS 116435]|uniref:Uncharacterized protein n=1 Tax=Polychaeton citri CBS 116435 TaxID=1314669 RepID=A0A9P4QED9_9PEZI|nr:hypothetical protein K431DRAFT_332594 [Polychaeton citri CBS 116435]
MMLSASATADTDTRRKMLSELHQEAVAAYKIACFRAQIAHHEVRAARRNASSCETRCKAIAAELQRLDESCTALPSTEDVRHGIEPDRRYANGMATAAICVDVNTSLDLGSVTCYERSSTYASADTSITFPHIEGNHPLMPFYRETSASPCQFYPTPNAVSTLGAAKRSHGEPPATPGYVEISTKSISSVEDLSEDELALPLAYSREARFDLHGHFPGRIPVKSPTSSQLYGLKELARRFNVREHTAQFRKDSYPSDPGFADLSVQKETSACPQPFEGQMVTSPIKYEARRSDRASTRESHNQRRVNKRPARPPPTGDESLRRSTRLRRYTNRIYV